MSEENVEIVRRSYGAYNEAMTAWNPPEAIRAFLERFADPEIEWELDPVTSVDERIYHGIDGVMEWLGVIREAFEQARQVPERFIDCRDQVLVFVRTEVRGRTSGIDVDEEWAHLVTLGDDGRVVRVQLLRDRDEALAAAGLRE